MSDDQTSQQESDLQKQLAETQRELTQLRAQASSRNEECSRLHKIILTSRPREYGIGDPALKRVWVDLSVLITRLVLGHFRKPIASPTGWAAYDEISDGADREYFLRSQVADSVYEAYFSPMMKMGYGLEPEVEDALAKFEIALLGLNGEKCLSIILLEDCYEMLTEVNRTPEEKLLASEIIKWRAETIRLGQFLGPPSRLRNTIEMDMMALHRKLHPNTPIPPEFLKIAQRLNAQAFQVSLSTRSSEADFEWSQKGPNSFPAADVLIAEDYKISPPGSGSGKRSLIAFAPVYKLVEGERVLVLKGEVLSS